MESSCVVLGLWSSSSGSSWKKSKRRSLRWKAVRSVKVSISGGVGGVGQKERPFPKSVYWESVRGISDRLMTVSLALFMRILFCSTAFSFLCSSFGRNLRERLEEDLEAFDCSFVVGLDTVWFADAIVVVW